jgi:hypothetical protein
MPEVTALVPADNVLDATNRPERFPRVNIGEGQTAFAVPYTRFHDKATLDVHIWCEEPGLTAAKEIAGAIATAIRGHFPNTPDYRFFSVISTAARYMRDPSGRHSHGVLTIEALLQEIAQ